MPPRSQYALIIVAVSNVWAMALLGYGRAAARLNWHIYGVVEDTSKYAGLPTMGSATLVISGITLLFLFESAHYFSHGDKPLRLGNKLFTGNTHIPTPTKFLWFANSNSIIGNAKWSYDIIVNTLPKLEAEECC